MLYDKDIREPLFEFLEETYGKIRIIEEKTMGRSRADIVMVRPESIAGIEIKSDADTYGRLKRQVKDYNQYFDFNYVVIGSTHVRHVHEHVPEWWGIISVEEVEGQVDFYMIRESQENPKVDPKKRLSILWRPELAHIQEIKAMFKYKAESKDFVMDKILLKVPEEELRPLISQELFERDYNAIAEVINAYRAANNQRPRRKRAYKRKRTKKK